jgi:hypothetical protein
MDVRYAARRRSLPLLHFHLHCSQYEKEGRTACHRLRLSFANYKRELLAAATGDTFRKVGFADAFLNGFEFSLGALNDRPFEPVARAD